MGQSPRERILELARTQQGTVRTADVLTAGIHNVYLRDLVADGSLAKPKNGLYFLTGAETVAGFFEVQLALPSAVICLGSALSYYNLSSYEPAVVHVAVRRDDKTKAPRFLPVRVFSFGGTRYEMGIVEEQIEGHTTRIYDREKTLCDAIRFRRILGEDVTYESLRTYLRSRRRSIDRLLDYAERLRMLPTVERMIRPYV